MADKHDRSVRRHDRQHGFEVPTELFDGERLRRGIPGLPVAALVVEHHAHLRSPLLDEPHPLKVEGAHAQRESVGEDDRQRSILGPDLADRQRYPVRRGDHATAVRIEQKEVLIGVWVVGGHAAGQRTDRRGTGKSTDANQPGHASHPARVANSAAAPPRFLVVQR
ncbi:MAG: hypothetical protein QOJ28_515 [Mycobacterium sp.]|nr:hypothetical protein [Mycobacterium sp.]